MRQKSLNFILPFVLVFFGLAAIYFFGLRTEYFDYLKDIASENIFLFVLALTLLKIVSIVWPPLPGGIFTLGSIPLIGWQSAYLVDFIGSMIGSTITYFLGKHYGLPLLQKIFDENIVKRIQSIKVKDNKHLELVIVLRIFTGSVFMEAITYGAGLLKLRFSSFIIGSIISHFIVGVPVYYFAEQALVSTQNLVVSGLLLIGIIIVLYKIKGRYLE